MKFLLASVLFLTIWAYFALFLQMSPPVSRLINLMSVTLTAGLVVAIIPLLKRKRSSKDLMVAVALYSVFAAGLLAIRDLDSRTPLGRFKKVYSKIRSGMTPTEVEKVLQREFPNVQFEIKWHPSGEISLGHVDPDYYMDIIHINIRDGRVVATEYLPD